MGADDIAIGSRSRRRRLENGEFDFDTFCHIVLDWRGWS